MRARLVLLAILVSSFGAAVSAAGCSSETGTSSGDGGEGGTTTSNSATSSTAGPGPVGSSSSGSSVQDRIAEPCTEDVQCGAGARCIKSSDNNPIFGGGPADGYCTIDCKEDADCPGTTSICLTDMNEENGICLRGCEFGPDLEFIDDPLDEEKCWGREDLRCQEIGNSPVCVPTCGSDDQCAGRKCDPQLTVCVDMPNMGTLENGQACDPMAPQCDGVCVSFSTDDPQKPVTMCSNWCVLGGELNGSFDCGGLTGGLCAFSPQGNGPGDFGVCAPACTDHDGCQHPNFWCTPVGFHNANGFCFGHSACMVQADCKNMGEVCTDTKHGKFCISDKYDLGSAAPSGTGGAGGSGGAGGAGGAGMGGAGGSGGN